MLVLPIQECREWTCDVCYCEFEGRAGEISTMVDDTKLCGQCVRQIFETSITSEMEFPPRWGGKVLDIWDFRHAFDTGLLTRFEKKANEWTCPPKERVYCKQSDAPRRPEECGTFLGRVTESKRCRQCSSCQWYTCLRCLNCFSTSDTEGTEVKIDHHCDPSVEQELRRRAFDGLKRGRDYQDCPNPRCERRIELKEGCNCILCSSCGTQFCYICGGKAAEGSGHWRPGSRCPKWNQPDTQNATFLDENDEQDDPFEAQLLYDQMRMIAMQTVQAYRDTQGGPGIGPDWRIHAMQRAEPFMHRETNPQPVYAVRTLQLPPTQATARNHPRPEEPTRQHRQYGGNLEITADGERYRDPNVGQVAQQVPHRVNGIIEPIDFATPSGPGDLLGRTHEITGLAQHPGPNRRRRLRREHVSSSQDPLYEQ